MKVLVLTQLFPNKKQPLLGIFVRERIVEVSKLCDLKVVAPVPWSPPLKVFKRWYRSSQIPYREIQEDIEVFHPRFFIIPKLGSSLQGFLYFLSIFPSILKIRPRFDFDLLDVHFAYPDGFAGALIAKVLKIPFTITVRGTDINLYPNYYLRKKMIIYGLQHSQRTIAVCEALASRVKDLGITKQKVVVIPNGINISKFMPISREEARKKLGLPKDRKVILSVGHLTPRKGFHHLIDAIANIKSIKGLQEILLLIIGNPDPEEMDYSNKLKLQVKRLGLNRHVIFIGGVPHEELYKWYSAADLFCLASLREGWPNVIFEALACGVPIVATKTWGIPEAICSPEYGILVDESNGELLADAILDGLKRKWDFRKIKEYASQNTWDKVAEKVLYEFTSVLEQPHV